MLLKHALVLHENQIVPLKGVWVDPNNQTHEGRVLGITRTGAGMYRILFEGLWGARPVTVTQSSNGDSESAALADEPIDAQFGSLILKVDHFRDDPLEWLAQHGIDLSELNAKTSKHASGAT